MSVSTEETYGIHNWHDRVSFCLPCVILTLRLYGRLLPYEIEIGLLRSLSDLVPITPLKVILFNKTSSTHMQGF